MSCCPPSAWPDLKTDYYCGGVVDHLGATGLPVYRVGKSERCIIWNYDIFGFDSGRTRQLADMMADTGFMVLIPDYYRGTLCDVTKEEQPAIKQFIQDKSNWEGALKLDWENSVKPYAEEHGAQLFGSIGTCWGSYPVMKLSALPDFRAGVSMHPSHPGICNILGESEEDLVRAVQCPQLFMPAAGDSDTTKTNGMAQQVLTSKKLTVVEFDKMQHGWTTRGDVSHPGVEDEVKRAFQLAVNFFKEHLVS